MTATTPRPHFKTALADQCLHSAEADVRPPRRKSGFDPEAVIGSMKYQRSSLSECRLVEIYFSRSIME